MRLRSGLALAAAAMLGAACQANREMTDAEREAVVDSVKAAHQALFATVPSRNVDSIMAFFVGPDRLTWADEGVVFSYDSLMQVIRTTLGSFRSLTLTSGQPKITVLAPDAAVLTTTFDETAIIDTIGTTIHLKGAWTAVYQHLDNRWLIGTVHESLPAPEPAPAAARRRG